MPHSFEYSLRQTHVAKKTRRRFEDFKHTFWLCVNNVIRKIQQSIPRWSETGIIAAQRGGTPLNENENTITFILLSQIPPKVINHWDRGSSNGGPGWKLNNFGQPTAKSIDLHRSLQKGKALLLSRLARILADWTCLFRHIRPSIHLDSLTTLNHSKS